MAHFQNLADDLARRRADVMNGWHNNPRTIPVPCNIGDSGDPCFVNRELPNPAYIPNMPEHSYVGFSDPPRRELDTSPIFHYTPAESSIYRPSATEFSSYSASDTSYGKPSYSPLSSDSTRDQFGNKRNQYGGYVSEAPSLWRP
jgi:hypothetical protein